MTERQIERHNPEDDEALRRKVRQVLASWTTVFANPPAITQVNQRMWVAAMQHQGVTVEEFTRLASGIVGTQKFYPTPYDLLARRGGVSQEPELAASRAWLMALDLLRARKGRVTPEDFDGDGAAVWVARTLGWRDLLHRFKQSEDPDRTRRDTRFEWIAAYKVALADGKVAEETEPEAHRMLPAPEAEPRQLTPDQQALADRVTAAMRAGRMDDVKEMLAGNGPRTGEMRPLGKQAEGGAR